MTPILISIIVFLAVVVAALAVFARKEAGKHGTSAGEEFIGICKSAVETASEKGERKEKIMVLLNERSASAFGRTESASGETQSAQGFGKTRELSNSEIRKALGVSSRTAVRYLDELEAEGKVEQVGKIGHAVTYRLK